MSLARGRPFAAALPLALLLSACAATQTAEAVSPEAPGFLLGLWHGIIFPFAFVLSLFMDQIEIYAVPNNGVLYNLGYFVGIVFFGVGARKSVVEVRRERHQETHRETHHETRVVHGEVIDARHAGEGERP